MFFWPGNSTAIGIISALTVSIWRKISEIVCPFWFYSNKELNYPFLGRQVFNDIQDTGTDIHVAESYNLILVANGVRSYI